MSERTFNVTFVADYFALTTTINLENARTMDDGEAEEVVVERATELLDSEYGFDMGVAFDVTVEEITEI